MFYKTSLYCTKQRQFLTGNKIAQSFDVRTHMQSSHCIGKFL